MERGKQASAMGGDGAGANFGGYQPPREDKSRPRIFHKPASLAYSSRKVFAGSIPAIRKVGTPVARSVTHARVRTTAAMVGTS